MTFRLQVPIFTLDAEFLGRPVDAERYFLQGIREALELAVNAILEEFCHGRQVELLIRDFPRVLEILRTILLLGTGWQVSPPIGLLGRCTLEGRVDWERIDAAWSRLIDRGWIRSDVFACLRGSELNEEENNDWERITM